MKINLTRAAINNARETGADPETDVAAIRSGEHTRESLLAHCLDGTDADRVQGWREYVSAVCDAAREGTKVMDQAKAIELGEREAPIMTTIQAGVGTNVSLTSEASAALQAVTGEAWEKLIEQVLCDATAEARRRGYEVRVRAGDGFWFAVAPDGGVYESSARSGDLHRYAQRTGRRTYEPID